MKLLLGCNRKSMYNINCEYRTSRRCVLILLFFPYQTPGVRGSFLAGGSFSVRRQLQQLGSPQEVVELLRLVFPAWSNNGWRLVAMSSGHQVEAPTPAEAAAALRGLALAARHSRLGVELR